MPKLPYFKSIVRESKILDLSQKGFDYRQIAEILNISRSHARLVARGDFSIKRKLITPYNLSSQEIAVAKLLIKGKSNNQCGEILKIQKRTVERHCSSIYRKLGIDNQANLSTRTAAAIILQNRI
jgi:DNA-binding NarL/FixJ family response regulator